MTYEPLMWSDGTEVPASVLRGATSMVLTDGVATSTDLTVSPRAEGANMSVDVAPGRAVVDGYIAQRSTKLNLPIGAPPPSGMVRIDSVQIRLDLPDWEIVAIAGTPSPDGTAPPVPPGAVELARVRVASGATSVTGTHITDRRMSAVWPDVSLFGSSYATFGGHVVSPGGSIATTATIAQPRGAGDVSVSATAMTTLNRIDSTGAPGVARIRVEVSRDGGSTWVNGGWITGNTPNPIMPSGIAADRVTRGPVTGSVQARLRVERLGGENLRLDGTLSILMMPS